MTKLISFSLNGQHYCVKSRVNIFEILQYFHFKNLFFILEYNSVICNKEEWKKTDIQDNDCIEIITIVGGG